MKFKISFTFIFACFTFLTWTSCDEIVEPLVVIDEQLSTDGFLDTLYFMDSVLTTEKQVLLEEFTGQKCVNCAEASLAARALAASLEPDLIIYSIHADYYAIPDETGYYTADYRCPEGDELYSHFQVFANPLALINRVKYNSSVLVGAANWETVVMQELAKPNRIDLRVRNIYYPNLNKVQTDVVARFLTQEEDLFKLVAYIVEDSIVSPQKNNNPAYPTPDWLDYQHHNILRGAINSTFGTYISEDGTVVQDQEYHNQFIYDLDSSWITDNCNIFVYIFSEESGEILQAAELGIKTAE